MRYTCRVWMTALACIVVAFGIMAVHTPVQAQCNATTCGAPVAGGPGDVNGSGVPVDAVDLVYLIDYCFLGGPAPVSLCNAEVNGLCNPKFPCEPTLGDVARLVEYLYLATGPLLDCTTANNPPPFGNLLGFPAFQSVTKAPTMKTITFPIYVENTGATPRNLYGYSMPIEFGLLGGGNGGGITAVSVGYQYKGPTGTWGANPGNWNRGANRVFAWAIPDAGLSSVQLVSGAPLKILEVSVSYITGSNAAKKPKIKVSTYADPTYPAEVAVLSLNGLLKSGSRSAEPSTEEQFRFAGARIPTTTNTGQAILVVLLLLAGILAASRYWRHQVQ